MSDIFTDREMRSINKVSKKMLAAANGSNPRVAGAAIGLMLANFMDTFSSSGDVSEGVDAIAGDAKDILQRRAIKRNWGKF